MAIDVGSEPINRGAYTDANYTEIDKTNPANESGTVDTIEVYMAAAAGGSIKVGLFYVVSGNNLTCRSWTTLTGLSLGYNKVTGLSLACEAGDYIGVYSSVATGQVDLDVTAGSGAGMWGTSGDRFGTPNRAYSFYANTYPISVKGTSSAADTGLTVGDAAQAQSAGAVTLTQAHTLAMVGATQAQAADVPTLTQAHTLAVQGSGQTQTAANVVLTQANSLTVQDAGQTQAAGVLALVQQHALAVQASGQAQSAEEPAPYEVVLLAADDAGQSQSAEEPTLAAVHLLRPDGAWQSQASEVPALSQAHTLAVAGAAQAQRAGTILRLLKPAPAVEGPSGATPAESGLRAASPAQSGLTTALLASDGHTLAEVA